MASQEAALGAPPAELADARARVRIRTDFDATLIVEAAAGAGKTTALVGRIAGALAAGAASLDRIVAVTFTDKAAGELKLRLRGEIERARRAADDAAARGRLDDALRKLEEARIGTIHSFCADLLRDYPVAAGVDPEFAVAGDDEAEEMIEQAFERWFERALAAPGEGLRRILRRRDPGDRDGPRPALLAAARDLIEWRDFDCDWADEPFERDSAIDGLVAEIAELGELARAGDPQDWLARALDQIARPIAEATRLERVRPRDYDALEHALTALLGGADGRWRWRGGGEFFGEIRRAPILERRDALRARLAEFRDRAGANLAPLLRRELWPVVAEYQEIKRREGRLDFLDLLLTARDLIRRDAAVRGELQRRFTHILVDEFQDTDPLQAEILMLLAADDPAVDDWRAARPAAGKLFLVGDPKQSIYRFRRADVALYETIKRRLIAAGAEIEYLTVSFRATPEPELQGMINSAFADAFAPPASAESQTQPSYVALKGFRRPYLDQPAIVALPAPNPYGDYGSITKWRIEESEADAIAAWIKWLVDESGWTVTEREAPNLRVPVRPRHVCVLFRRMNSHGRDVTRRYVRALEARHVPHVLVRGGSFHQREEIEALRNALGAIERPDDELLVFATLHGPLFAIADGPLLEYRATIGRLHPFAPPPDDLPERLPEIPAALAILRGLHHERNRRPIAETIARLLAATRAHAAIAIWPNGDQALANIARLMDIARRYDSRAGARSMRGFLEFLEDRGEREQAGDVPVVEDGAEGVRLMTVHRAKGLEFPVVILADSTCNETPTRASRFLDSERRLCALRIAGCAPRELLDREAEEMRREQEEAVRLLYVATTRARDLLVVPTVGDERREGWLARLHPVIYPDPRQARAPIERGGPGCPPFKAERAGFRPPNARQRGPGVTPGTHRPEAGAHRVVWWDTTLLELNVRETMGLRQESLLQADERQFRSEQSRIEHERWRERRAQALAAGATASRKIVPASQSAAIGASGAPESEAIEAIELPHAPDRPHGRRFGALVHAVMERARPDARRDAIARQAEYFARMTGSGADEIAAAVAAVAQALQAEPLRRAAAAAEVRRETPLSVVLDDGTLVEGLIDLAYMEMDAAGAQRWTVVDYKTDADLGARLDEYRAQVALYVRAIAMATGAPTRGIILRI
jgi:ATP-dependent helicase/nuclease subunit A